MIRRAGILPIPNWLTKEEFSFDVEEILKDSLYYPSSEFDGNPIKYFMGNVYSFVYVDYGVSREKLLEKLDTNGIYGYHIIHQESIKVNQLKSSTYRKIDLPEPEDMRRLRIHFKNHVQPPFCEWLVFERNSDKTERFNPKRFSLLYLCAEGVASYQEMYVRNRIKPKIIAIIQPGHGFGTNWTDFTDRNQIFAKSVFHDTNLLPDYLINGGWGPPKFHIDPIWEEYSKRIRFIRSDRSSFALWEKACIKNREKN
ncbi:MAG: hypothetical protein JJT78_01220 [Leptospira sp.]|nr:hypothetical protein [Leptospira sp.]